MPANTTSSRPSATVSVSLRDTTATGFPEPTAVVTFVVRHVGATETVVPIAWEDLDGDLTPEITGNAAPTEPFGCRRTGHLQRTGPRGR